MRIVSARVSGIALALVVAVTALWARIVLLRSSRRRHPLPFRRRQADRSGACSPGCAGAPSGRHAADDRRLSPEARAGRSSTTSARPAAASGKPPTAGLTWRAGVGPVSSRPLRSARSPLPSRTRTSSTSAWARRSCAATSSRATASTRRTDAGRTWTHLGLEKTLAIGAHPRPSHESRHRVRRRARRSVRRQRRSAACSRRPTAARPGRRCCSATTRPARSICRSIRRTPTSCTRRSGKCSARRIRSRAAARAAACSRARTAATTWTELTKNAGLPKPIWGKVGVAVSGADPNRVYAIDRSGRRRRLLSDDAGATWKLVNDDRRLRQRAFYYTRIYADPKAKDTVYVLNIAVLSLDRRRQDDPHHLGAARRQPRPVDCAERSEAHDQQQRRRRQRLDQRRRELDRPGFSDRAVLQRLHDRARAVSRLRRAAGQQHGLRAEHRRRRALRGRRRRERLHRAGPGGHRRLLCRQLRRPADAHQPPDRRAPRDQRLARQPDGILGRDITERFQWTYPIVIAPTDPDTLYVTSQHVWKSTNEGQSVDSASARTSRAHDPSTLGPSGGPITLDQTGVETYATSSRWRRRA